MTNTLYHRCQNAGAYRPHNSDATSILNCAFDRPCFFTHGSGTDFPTLVLFLSKYVIKVECFNTNHENNYKKYIT